MNSISEPLPKDEGSLVDSLSPRERQLLDMATNGLTDQAIANSLGISLPTVSTYWGRIRIKYGPQGRTEIVARYLRALMVRSNSVLQATEARLRKVLEACPMGVILTDAEGTPLYVNPAHEKITGQDLTALVQNGVHSLVHPDDRDCVVATWERCLHDGAPYHSEHRYIRPDGSILWVRSHGDSWHEGEEIGGRVSLIEDVTIEHEAHARRLESEERYQSLFAFAPVAIVSADEDLIVVSLNACAEQMFGYKADEIVGRPLQTLIPDPLSDAKTYLEGFGGGATIGEVPSADRPEVRGRRRNGAEFLCEASVVGQRVDGKPHYTAILREVAKPVSPLGRDESIEQIPLIAWRLDQKGDFAEGNAALRHTVRGLTVTNRYGLSHPEEIETFAEALRLTAAEGVKADVRVRLWCASEGADRWHIARIQALPQGGWLVVCTDVHELEVAADELRRIREVLLSPR